MQRSEACRSPLSIHRSFVVRFRTGTDVDAGNVTGRVEHVASPEAATFESWTELQAFIAQVLTRVQATAPEVPE